MSKPLFRTEFTSPGGERTVRLNVGLARSPAEIEAAQRLRFEIFAGEFGARLETSRPGIDEDRFDPFCRHLVVRDEQIDHVVGTYRLLFPEGALRAGGYYSSGEFDISRLLALPGRILEVGRSCVHPYYRSGATISLLWAGLGTVLQQEKMDYLMGCASVHDEDGARVGALFNRLAQKHCLPEELRVIPNKKLPDFNPLSTAEASEIPPLMRGYLLAGARIGGEPAWDPDFHAADFLILLNTHDISPRYWRRFCENLRPV